MWDRHLVGGTVADLHHRDLPLDRRSVWVMDPTMPTLVFGSAQRDGVIDASAARNYGWETCRRHSGGGLVALDPDDVVWLDVVVPRGDQLWCDDVGAAFEWLGAAWVRALGTLGIEGEAHAGAPQRAAAGRVVCFAGVGTGEVSVAGAKLVGLSQRRTRLGARFQCLIHLSWQPERWWPAVSPSVPSDLRWELDEAIRNRVVALDELGVDGPGTADLVVAGLVSELLQLD